MTNQQQFLKEITSKALLNLNITYRSGNIESFRERISVTLNHADNNVFEGFETLKHIVLNQEEGGSPPSIEALLEDSGGNQVIWTACYINEGGTPQGPFRLKGGLIISKLGIEETANLTFET